MSTDLSKHYEHAYWKIRAVLENAHDNLPSPHVLWGDLNELLEVLDGMEKLLNIPNGSFLGIRALR